MAEQATDDAPVMLPRKAIQLALRMLQTLNQRGAASVSIMAIGEAWYVSVNGGQPERLG